MEENPYQSPLSSTRKPMVTLPKAIMTVVLTALCFGLAGLGIGAFLGRYAPGFFRQMIPVRDPANFEPLELGIGLGLVNGLLWGLGIGVVVVAIVAWKEVRIAGKQQLSGLQHTPQDTTR